MIGNLKKNPGMRILVASALLIGFHSTMALADPPPPPGSKPVSELLQSIEKSPDFGYIDEVEWEDNALEVKFYTKTGTKKKVYLDPKSGEQLSGNQRPY